MFWDGGSHSAVQAGLELFGPSDYTFYAFWAASTTITHFEYDWNEIQTFSFFLSFTISLKDLFICNHPSTFTK